MRRRCASLSIGCERFSEKALTPWLVDVGKQGPQHCSKDQHVHEDTNGLPALKAIEDGGQCMLILLIASLTQERGCCPCEGNKHV